MNATDAPICPDDRIAMKKVVHPDLTLNECERCGGIYLDGGELNQLVVSLSGDVERASLVDLNPIRDDRPERICPRCPEKTMQKVELVVHTGVIVDYCAECRGFFLDRGELEKANEILLGAAQNREPEEFRRTVEGRLVVGKYHKAVSPAQAPSVIGTAFAVPVKYVSIGVYFGRPLGIGLSLSREGLLHRLGRIFGLRSGEVRLGDERFDRLFRLAAANPVGARAALQPRARERLVRFLESGPAIVQKSGSDLKINDNGIFYLEGPYRDDSPIDLPAQSEPVVRELLDIVRLVEEDLAI